VGGAFRPCCLRRAAGWACSFSRRIQRGPTGRENPYWLLSQGCAALHPGAIFMFSLREKPRAGGGGDGQMPGAVHPAHFDWAPMVGIVLQNPLLPVRAFPGPKDRDLGHPRSCGLMLRKSRSFPSLTSAGPQVTPMTKTCHWGPRQTRSVQDDKSSII
jgi:hypothetical protein